MYNESNEKQKTYNTSDDFIECLNNNLFRNIDIHV